MESRHRKLHLTRHVSTPESSRFSFESFAHSFILIYFRVVYDFCCSREANIFPIISPVKQNKGDKILAKRRQNYSYLQVMYL